MKCLSSRRARRILLQRAAERRINEHLRVLPLKVDSEPYSEPLRGLGVQENLGAAPPYEDDEDIYEQAAQKGILCLVPQNTAQDLTTTVQGLVAKRETGTGRIDDSVAYHREPEGNWGFSIPTNPEFYDDQFITD